MVAFVAERWRLRDHAKKDAERDAEGSTALVVVVLQADKSLRLLAFLQNTLRSAADRINKSNFRGRCGTVNYHTLLNL